MNRGLGSWLLLFSLVGSGILYIVLFFWYLIYLELVM